MTYNLPGSKVKRFALPVLFLLFLAFSLAGINCADDPTSLGLVFLPAGETTGVRIFDSYIDTMQITTHTFKYRVNTFGSGNLLVGSNGTYNSKALLKFINLPTDKAGATVDTAILKLKYKNYYFPTSRQDSLGQISFNIYRVLKNFDYTKVTLDSITSGSFGTVPKGTYTGSPSGNDSEEVDIFLDNAMVKDWLEYAANPSYSTPNYGIVLSPNSGSNVLKSFYSAISGSGVVPQIIIKYRLNNVRDTIIHNQSYTCYLSDANEVIPDGEFYIQGGIAYNTILKFDVSKIPAEATINDAQVILTLDPDHSKFTSQTLYVLLGAYVTDTAGPKTDAFIERTNVLRNVYTLRYITAFQRWHNGETNYGIMMIPQNQGANLDLFAFYNENAPDPAKRPRVLITYTPRVKP